MKKNRLMLTGILLLVGALVIGCNNAAGGDDSVAYTMESIVDAKGFSFTTRAGTATLAITSAAAGSDGTYTGDLAFAMGATLGKQTGTYTATPVEGKDSTYDVVVVYSTKSSGAYRVQITGENTILVWMSTVSYTALPATYTATGTPKEASKSGMEKVVSDSAYTIQGRISPHTIRIKTAVASGTKYTGEAEYTNQMVGGGTPLSGTYTATPVTSGDTSEYYVEFFFDYGGGITHMGFKFTIGEDGKTLTLNMLTFGVTAPSGDGTEATRNT